MFVTQQFNVSCCLTPTKEKIIAPGRFGKAVTTELLISAVMWDDLERDEYAIHPPKNTVTIFASTERRAKRREILLLEARAIKHIIMAKFPELLFIVKESTSPFNTDFEEWVYLCDIRETNVKMLTVRLRGRVVTYKW